MGMLAQLDGFLTRLFTPGAQAVDPSSLTFGVPTENFTPMEYGDYLAASSGVYVCSKKRATLLSSLPLQLTRLKRDSVAEPVMKGSLWELTQKVNPYWTWRRLIEMTEMSLCAWGASYWYVNRGASGTGEPREILWMRPDRMRVFPHRDRYVDHFEYQSASGVAPAPFKPSEIIWFRYPNPLDEYSGLSPLAAARLAADTQSAAGKANLNIFRNGVMGAGFIVPDKDAKEFTPEQATQLTEMLDKRMKGVDRAHRIAVLRLAMQYVPLSLNPKDAEYIALHQLTLEDIARAYGIPLDLIGGKRTFENYSSALKAVWTETILPEAGFIADELTEQLLPMFPGQADLCAFDHSAVEVLQEDEQREWQIAGDQIKSGAIVVNEWRKDKGLDPLPWGDAWWGSLALVPITTADLPEPEPEPVATPALPEGETEEDDVDRALRTLLGSDPHHGRMLAAAGGIAADRHHQRPHVRVAYDSDEHQRLYRLFVRRTTPLEARVKKVAVELFRRQQQSILTELGKVEDRASRAAEPDDADSLMAQIYSMARWRKEFRKAIKPVLTLIATDAGQQALDEVTTGVGFDVMDPQVARFLEQQAQRFAREVNETTWDQLKASLIEGLEAGEGIDVLKERVRAVMGARIRSSAEVIARTETITAYNGGTLEGWRQSGQVESKTWMSALDDRTRETHVDAHNQTVAIDGNFTVGDGSGPTPGQIGLPEEDIQCRCFMIAGLKA